MERDLGTSGRGAPSPARMDINADLGESFGHWVMGDDAGLLPFVQTINMACGFHAGDPLTMERTIELAQGSGTAIGAHPGFPDLLGFGRRALNVSPEEAYSYVIYQVGALREMLALRGLTLHHVKTHGAFDGMVYTDSACAEAVADAIRDMGIGLIYRAWIPSPDPFYEAACERGITVVRELYPDLDYGPGGFPQGARDLTPRSADGIIDRVRAFLAEGFVRTTDGQTVAIDAQSICIHGDGPHAIAAAKGVLELLRSTGVEVGAPEPLQPTKIA